LRYFQLGLRIEGADSNVSIIAVDDISDVDLIGSSSPDVGVRACTDHDVVGPGRDRVASDPSEGSIPNPVCDGLEAIGSDARVSVSTGIREGGPSNSSVVGFA
jgi:hypothetical protein